MGGEKKTLKVNELFSGVGAQAKALERLGIPREIMCTSDIDKDAIVSYAAIHCGLTPHMVDTYDKYPPRQEMADYLEKLNIGAEFKDGIMIPYNWNALVHRKSNALEKYWLAAVISNQIGDISKADRLPKADMWTYSFPCTDLSVAGKQQGISKGTRSGLLLEVERLLLKSAENNELPSYLQLENVKNLVGKRFRADFYRWLNFLETLGYENHWQVMNAKDYGVPQNRERVFCISIKRELQQDFEFPKPITLELRLKDLLEKNVPEKYYLSDKSIENFITCINGKIGGINLSNKGNCLKKQTDIATCIMARDYKGFGNQEMTGVFELE